LYYTGFLDHAVHTMDGRPIPSSLGRSPLD
jgi:hypothetical protein